LGAKSLSQVLTGRLRISATDAKRRIGEADDLGPRVTLSGQTLPPVLPKVAAAQAQGRINAEHVTIIRDFYDKVPAWVDVEVRELT
jgi:hypothetical protein